MSYIRYGEDMRPDPPKKREQKAEPTQLAYGLWIDENGIILTKKLWNKLKPLRKHMQKRGYEMRLNKMFCKRHNLKDGKSNFAAVDIRIYNPREKRFVTVKDMVKYPHERKQVVRALGEEMVEISRKKNLHLLVLNSYIYPNNNTCPDGYFHIEDLDATAEILQRSYETLFPEYGMKGK